jgi:DNA (cytosine-5)-methyltransferase 1
MGSIESSLCGAKSFIITQARDLGEYNMTGPASGHEHPAGPPHADTEEPLFIDAFAGCGGLSLGLLRAGWRGLFAIEKDAFAFETYQTNLLRGKYSSHFSWPSWLPVRPTCIKRILDEHCQDLSRLRGKVALLAGGPPCQGFSSAGRRDASDPRNELMRGYLQLVEMIEPSIVLLENVRGITIDFNQPEGSQALVNYADFLRATLGTTYEVFSMMANAADFGVPQARMRFVLIASHRRLGIDASALGGHFDHWRRRFLRKNRLLPPTSAMAAISDLEVERHGTTECPDSEGFMAIRYGGPRTHYQRLLRDGHDGPPSDTRLARHQPDIIARFGEIISRCDRKGRLNISIDREMREEYGLKKRALRVLDPDRPAPTITSMPDDLLHYREPRTLTVRENARLQGFPDWFAFKGKYTTGGHLRRREVPRFTQVANAVPPLMAEVFGAALLEIWSQGRASRTGITAGAGGEEGSVQRDVDENRYVGEVQPMCDEIAPQPRHVFISDRSLRTV